MNFVGGGVGGYKIQSIAPNKTLLGKLTFEFYIIPMCHEILFSFGFFLIPFKNVKTTLSSWAKFADTYLGEKILMDSQIAISGW